MKYMEMVLVKNLEHQLQGVEKTEIIIYQQDLIIREVWLQALHLKAVIFELI